MNLILITFIILILINSRFNSPAIDYLSRERCQSLRGILAIFIIMHHLAQRTASGEAFRVMEQAGFLMTSLFFFMSGYGLMLRNKSDDTYRRTFFRKRLPHLVILYAAITFIYWLMCRCIGTYYTLKDVLYGAFVAGAPIDSFTWYIVVILVTYVVFGILIKIFGNRNVLVIIGMSLFYGGFVWYCIRMGYGCWWYNTLHMLLVGMIYALIKEKIDKLSGAFYWIILTILGIASVYLYSNLVPMIDACPYEQSEYLVKLLVSIVVTIFILQLMRVLTLENMLTKALGRISLEIYLCQGLLITFTRSSRLYIENEAYWSLVVILGTVTVAAIVYGVEKKLKK